MGQGIGTTIQKISEGIQKLIETVRAPMAEIPAVLLVCSTIKRPGLSATLIASNIIRRQAEAGAPVGPAADGSPNVSEAMEVIRVQELVKALKFDSKVQVGIATGALQITGYGGNAGGPVVIQGFNINNAHADGIIG